MDRELRGARLERPRWIRQPMELLATAIIKLAKLNIISDLC